MKQWWPMLVYMIVSAVTPGPNNLTCLYLGGSLGVRGSRKFIIASVLSVLVKALLCGLLNVALADVLPAAVDVVKWLGAAYMLWLAWKMARSGWEEDSDSSGVRRSAEYRDGIILQLLNGKSWIGALSIFAVYVIPVTTSLRAVVLASLAYALAIAAASLLWTACGTAIRGFIAKHRKAFGILMALSLVWCAVTAVL